MNRHTGEQIDTMQHIRQSVTDILTTPIGSRVMRREYGSLLPSLIDAPVNDATNLQLVAATVMALMRWEPRLWLERVQVDFNQPARCTVSVEAIGEQGEQLSFTAALPTGAAA